MTSTSEGLDTLSVSARVLASWLGLTDRRIRQLAEAGVIAKDRRGRYPLKAAVRAYVDWAERPREAVDLHDAKRRKTAAEAELLELELARERSAVAPIAEMERAWSALVLSWKEAIRSVPAAATVHVPGFTPAMARALQRLIDTTLTELADGKKRRK